MSLEEVVRSLGPPDRRETYHTGRPGRYVYDGQQLAVQFDDPLRDEIPSRVYMIHTTGNRYAGADGVTIGSSRAEVEAAYGLDYERVEGEGFWVMFYEALGIRFECESGSDRVRTIGVFPPDRPVETPTDDDPVEDWEEDLEF